MSPSRRLPATSARQKKKKLSAEQLKMAIVPVSPWMGRLRSHHATPQGLPKQTVPMQTKSPEGKEEHQTLRKKQAATNKTARAGQTGAARQPRAGLRRSSRFSGRDLENPIVIDDDEKEEPKSRADLSAITPLRRSPRFHLEDNNLGKSMFPPNPMETCPNRKTKDANRKDKNQESQKRNRRSPRFYLEDKSLGKSLLPSNPQETCPNRKTKDANRKDKSQECKKRNTRSAGLPPRKDVSDASNKKSDKQELEPNRCEVLTGKRKRGTEKRLPLKKQSCQDPEPLPAHCQETAPHNEPRKSVHRRVKKDPSVEVKLKTGGQKLTTIDENSKPSGTEREGIGIFCGSDDWTKEQDMALRKAYFSARPSPHFWKRVSKMVPGRSAEDCFNRIYTDLSTPTQIARRPRTSKATFSPIGNFTLSDSKLPDILKPIVGRRKTAKQKSLVAQKAVRHLLQKHCRIDQAQEADHFSIFESSPSALQLNLSFEDSPGTPDSYMNSDSLGKRSGSSSARKKPFSRLRTKPSEPSPEVLKPIKNVILHEKYIDRLSRREGTKRKRPRRRAPGSKAADFGKSLSEQQAGGLKAAKNALISEATDFISSFRSLQANSLAHIVENSEGDETECDDSD